MISDHLTLLVLLFELPCLVAVTVVPFRRVTDVNRHDAERRCWLLLRGLACAAVFVVLQVFIFGVMDWLRPEDHVGTLGGFFSLGALIWDICCWIWILGSIVTGIFYVHLMYLSAFGKNSFIRPPDDPGGFLFILF